MNKLIAEREQHIAAVRAMNDEANVQRIRSQFGPIVRVEEDTATGPIADATANARRHAATIAAEERNIKHIRNLTRDPTTVREEDRQREMQLGRVAIPRRTAAAARTG